MFNIWNNLYVFFNTLSKFKSQGSNFEQDTDFKIIFYVKKAHFFAKP